MLQHATVRIGLTKLHMSIHRLYLEISDYGITFETMHIYMGFFVFFYYNTAIIANDY